MKIIPLMLISAWLFFSCKKSNVSFEANYTLEEPVIVEHKLNGDYSLFFDNDGLWNIFTGPSPLKINWKEPFSTFEGALVTLPGFEATERFFFGITSVGGDTLIAGERQIPMEGQINFRDLGGLPTEDGRRVEWGVFYRSGELSELTSRDLQYFSELGIKTIVDLRNDVEIKKEPDRYPAGVEHRQVTIGDREGKAYTELRRKVIVGGYRRAKAKQLVIEVMEGFADSVAIDVKPFFDLAMKEKNLPLVFHCTGGKDRTGFVASLLLMALGVERQAIKQDYLLSNFYRQEKNVSLMKKARYLGIDDETLVNVLMVNEAYIQAVFDVIDKKYNGVENYFFEKFGITGAELAEFRNKHLYRLSSEPTIAGKKDTSSVVNIE